MPFTFSDEKKQAQTHAQAAVTASAYHDDCEDTTLLNDDDDVDSKSETRIDLNSYSGCPPSSPCSTSWISGFSSSRSKSRCIIAAPFILICIALASESHSHGTSRVKAIFSEKKQCQDPYSMPGYLFHNDKAGTARWIPFTDSVLHSNATPATVPPFRDTTSMNDEILSLSPPSYATKLKNRNKDPLAENADLEFMRDKTILLLGCSLDRFFMQSFCESNGAKIINIKDGWHGMFKCTIPDINLHLQLWFTYGALSGHKSSTDHSEIRNFEDRIRDYWLPQAVKANLTTQPDMIIWASGTWDVLGLRMKFAGDKTRWKEQAMSYQEIVWHRRRMYEMVDFLRTQWPDVPTLYRPPTYLYKKDIPSHNGFLKGVKIEDIDQINEAIYQVGQSAEAVMREVGMPLFRWGEKLVGTNQFSDTMHFKANSYPQWLYAEMMLYYLLYYSMPKPSHCIQSGPGS